MTVVVKKIMSQRKVINKIVVVNAHVNYKNNRNNSNNKVLVLKKNKDIVVNKVLV